METTLARALVRVDDLRYNKNDFQGQVKLYLQGWCGTHSFLQLQKQFAGVGNMPAPYKGIFRDGSSRHPPL